MFRFCLLALTIFIPTVVNAVEITEIAWMGSHGSANHEWIELRAAQTTDVTGWEISDGNNLSIILDGTISADSHVVLERTSDASASGSAWQIYTGSLVNTGATLKLYDAAGGMVDKVVGGTDWESVGGDNVTKDTAQLSSNGWITAVATPGKAADVSPTVTAADDDPDGDKDKIKTTTSSKSNFSNQSVELTLPDVTLRLAIEAPELVYVNQPVTFKVKPRGVGDTIADSLSYQWNFGDGEQASGKEVTYSYPYAGNYVVVVDGHYKRQQQFQRHVVTVLPVSLSLVRLKNGDTTIQNTSQTEIDLAGYRLVGDETFLIPDHTIVLPQSQITIPTHKFSSHDIDQMIVLYDQANAPTATVIPTIFARRTDSSFASQSEPSRPAPRISAIDHSPRYMFASDTSVDNTKSKPAINVVKSPPKKGALVGVLLLGISGIYLLPRKEKDDSPWD